MSYLRHGVPLLFAACVALTGCSGGDGSPASDPQEEDVKAAASDKDFKAKLAALIAGDVSLADTTGPTRLVEGASKVGDMTIPVIQRELAAPISKALADKRDLKTMSTEATDIQDLLAGTTDRANDPKNSAAARDQFRKLGEALKLMQTLNGLQTLLFFSGDEGFIAVVVGKSKASGKLIALVAAGK